ncbi:hypothetical protein GCK72_016768 [Caenorhabditis remanei]|uniref:Uncharacterized protein n=1 Tax=Caenorhabditis remanei TaxID=31234 RepID=A0A6A5G694_CAERE|nr:hypothetical protein GCK72_016768 [Caenorhabditis remanei]KAF1750221.1 hypothetical protein GCK72_016768 [Caenorhabditis remanei]
MNTLSILFILTIGFSSRVISLQLVNDEPQFFMDHGEVAVISQDRPDVPGEIFGRNGEFPTHVTFNDNEINKEKPTTKKIYQ